MAKTKPILLTGNQARFLRGLGHHLSPLVHIGKEGISKNLIDSTGQVLLAHELIKVKVQENCPLDRKEVGPLLAEKTGASVAQTIGRIILLYKENKDLNEDKKIKLPKK
ncbi:MAG: ribosome assembly RNA-binding protein YhbY [Proteobacteria bacterium]|nr:ribosome assembly RNA-binding protein YhbY [Pseudomonadota bacterium]MBU1708830.1 ribosome assembly RNA-binding protein YhbY [Pseudomonadota bacterium]